MIATIRWPAARVRVESSQYPPRLTSGGVGEGEVLCLMKAPGGACTKTKVLLAGTAEVHCLIGRGREDKLKV